MCITATNDYPQSAILKKGLIKISFITPVGQFYARNHPLISTKGKMYPKNYDMFLYLSYDKMIGDIQQAFSREYPFLKLEFCKPGLEGPSPVATKRLPAIVTLKDAGLKKDGLIDIQNNMTVSDLEKVLYYEFGLNGQVSRQSGKLWLETNMTDKWTLQKQNEHGRELTTPLEKRRGENNEML